MIVNFEGEEIKHIVSVMEKSLTERDERRGDTNTKFTVTGNMSQTPVKIQYRNNWYWIKEGEKEILDQLNIQYDNVVVLWYVPGMISPLLEVDISTSPLKNVDGYEVYINYNKSTNDNN